MPTIWTYSRIFRSKVSIEDSITDHDKIIVVRVGRATRIVIMVRATVTQICQCAVVFLRIWIFIAMVEFSKSSSGNGMR